MTGLDTLVVGEELREREGAGRFRNAPRRHAEADEPLDSILGFLAGVALAGSAVYYNILDEYRISNQLLSEDVYVCPHSSLSHCLKFPMPTIERSSRRCKRGRCLRQS